MKLLRIISVVAAALSLYIPAHADWLPNYVFNPDSNHGQFTTYGLMFEPQSDIFMRSGGNAWASLGGYISIFEFPEWKWKPQLAVHGSANASYRLDYGTDLSILTKFETIDARVGLAWDMTFSDTFRGAIIWTHDSGHISDNVALPELIGPDVGDEYFDFRLIKDTEDQHWRYGGGFDPALKSHPTQQWFSAEEFVEWWPHGPSKNPHSAVPFVAGGLQQYGTDAIELTGNIQLGWATGDHFSPHFEKAWRFVIGAYSGQDMRLKYYKYEGTQTHTVYAGFFLDI